MQERIEAQQISPETVCIPKSLRGTRRPLSDFLPHIIFKTITPLQSFKLETKSVKIEPRNKWNPSRIDYFGICVSAIFIASGIGSGVLLWICIIILLFRKRAYFEVKKLMPELEYVHVPKIVKSRQNNEGLSQSLWVRISNLIEIFTNKQSSTKDLNIETPETGMVELPQAAENLPTMTQKGLFETYSVIYLGGHPEHPKSKAGSISLQAFSDRFMLIPTFGTKNWLKGITIKYESITDLRIVQRQVSTLEGLLGGLDSRQLNQLNNIHIIYKDEQGIGNLILRLEMLSGITVMGQAIKCLEFEDRLRTHHIRDKFRPSTIQSTPVTISIDIPLQIEKLADLRDKQILSASEFEAKKTELLSRM